MKIRSVKLTHFKRFEHLELDFTDPITQSARDFVVLVGHNGAGKSTVLQAIAACLGTVTERIRRPSFLRWQNFSLALAGRSWPTPPTVVVEVEFTEQELTDTALMFQEVEPELPPPTFHSIVTVTMHGNTVSCTPDEATWQFRGRHFADVLAKTVGAHLYQQAGYIHWYGDQRNLRSILLNRPEEKTAEPIETLRRRLSQWQWFHERIKRGEYHLQPEERDLYARLEEAYRAIFPNRRLVGAVPDSRVGQVWNEPLFLLDDGNKQYELREISGGERAVFPILFDFVDFEIHRSTILIDEFELHLHPPMQQALVRALRALGRGNQFIVSTHSNSVVDVLPPDHIVWIKEAKP
jgi:predicted ATPase